MNSILLNDENGTITDPTVLEHLHAQLKLVIGDEVKITILNKGIGKGIVQSITPTLCQIKIKEILPATPTWFELIVGVSRPQTTKKIFEHGATFGAIGFHFYQADLSEKSYLDSKVFETEQALSLMKLGLSQSTIYADMPKLQLHKYNPAKLFNDHPQKYILDLNGTETFADQQIDFKFPICLSIGPERGFTKADIAHFTNAGFKSIKISSTVLRVEHAIYSAVSQLEMLKMQQLKN